MDRKEGELMENIVKITRSGGHISTEGESLDQIKSLCSLAFVDACLREGMAEERILGIVFDTVFLVRRLMREGKTT